MPEDHRLKWGCDSLTNQQGRNPLLAGAIFCACRVVGRSTTCPHWTRAKIQFDALYARIRRAITCHESQFAKIAPFAGLLHPKNPEIPTYTHKAVVFTLARQSDAGFVTT